MCLWGDGAYGRQFLYVVFAFFRPGHCFGLEILQNAACFLQSFCYVLVSELSPCPGDNLQLLVEIIAEFLGLIAEVCNSAGYVGSIQVQRKHLTDRLTKGHHGTHCISPKFETVVVDANKGRLHMLCK